jgi:lipopolysaccharide transport system ATP-binding protein
MQAHAELALAEVPQDAAGAEEAAAAAAPAADDVVIRVRGLSKCYLIYDRPQDRLKQALVPRLRRLLGRPSRSYYREFWALRDVSFEVRRGETVGIIGRNGSGKSTLLQILCGTLFPNAGSVEVRGRVAALLELGSGFNPEFTGRENVYLYASVLGLSRAEVDARFDAIAAFADIGDFIDQPLKTYSSGMHVRLAFAVAVCVDPDILVVDEALAVGDEAFQRKCFARIEEMKAHGATILFVSHSTQIIVELCQRALLIEKGELAMEGAPKTVIAWYQQLLYATGERAAQVRAALRRAAAGIEPAILPELAQTEAASALPEESMDFYDPALKPQTTQTYLENGACITNVRITDESGRRVNVLTHGRRYLYRYEVAFSEHVDVVDFAMLIKTVSGLELAGQTMYRVGGYSARAGQVVEIAFPFVASMLPGAYFVNAGCYSRAGSHRQLHRIIDAIMFKVTPWTPPRPRLGIVDIVPEGCFGEATLRVIKA